jgi:xylulokinase
LRFRPCRSELLVVGGGSRNKLWRRVLADAFQLPLRFPAEPEAAALGAALQAAAVHSGAPVADYVARHPPPMGKPAFLAYCCLWIVERAHAMWVQLRH